MRVIVLDIETSGLNPDVDCILQLAMREVDPNTYEPLPGEAFNSPVYAGPHALARVRRTPVVLEMHTKTGLLDRCATAPRRADVQRAALAWLGHDKDDTQIIMAGDSIHFDRAFLRVHMPLLALAFHYRMIDTTSLFLVAQTAGLGFDLVNESEHDALSDVDHSIRKLQHYRKVCEDARQYRYEADAKVPA